MSRKVMGAVLAFFLAVTGVGVSMSSAFAAGVDQEKNHTSYWEAQGYGTCVKVEMNDQGASVTLNATIPAGNVYTILVLKSALVNDTFANPVQGGVYTTRSGKDISHYIYCYKAPETPSTPVTTPVETPTTAVPVVTPTKREVPKPDVTKTKTETKTETTPAPTATTRAPHRGELADTGGAQTLLLALIGGGLAAAGALFYSLARRPGKH